MNLLSNACKFQKEGIIYVRARVFQTGKERDAVMIEIEVEDKGIGIA